MEIPFNKVSLTGKETKYVKDAIKNIQSQSYLNKCAEWIKMHHPTHKVMMTASATTALELAIHAIQIQKDDEVILPSFTFPSIANAVLRIGAIPIFCEINPNHLCIDIHDFQSKITHKTKAVIPVHYGGFSSNLQDLIDTAKANHLHIIEDAAHAFNAFYEQKPLGTWGDFGIFSFHSTKNIVCGEGGALMINTDDQDINKRLDYLYHNGTNRTEYLKGQSNHYEWKTMGLNPYPSELSMAFLFAQLEASNTLTAMRKKIFLTYYTYFSEIKNESIISFSKMNRHVQSNYHTFYLICKNNNIRNHILQKLRQKDIMASFHFVPLHSSDMGKKLGYSSSDLPKTQNISECIIRLPIYNNMTLEEVNYVIETIDLILKELP